MPDLSGLLAEGRALRLGVYGPENRPPTLTGEHLPERTDPGFRCEAVLAAADDTEATPVTRVTIYSEIGGWFGVWPDEVAAELAAIEGDIELHLHSPGGVAFDGIAIYNAFRQHPGDVTVVIDGLAASAASVVAMCGNKIRMSRGAQMMIHEAWGMSVGNEADMAKYGSFLGKISGAAADIYAARAGGTEADWRKAMKAETWYRDREAVEAGLADEVESSVAAAKNHWGLKAFAYAGRDAAPDPEFPGGRRDVPPLPPKETPAQAAARMAEAAAKARAAKDPQTPDASPAAGPTSTEGAPAMGAAETILEALGLSPDATKEQVNAAMTALRTGPAGSTDTPPAVPGTSDSKSLAELAKMAKDTGVVLIDQAQLTEMVSMAKQGADAAKQMRENQRDAVIDKAAKDGKIALSRIDHWRTAWDKDPEGTRDALDSLAPNMIPVEVSGYAGRGDFALTEAEAAYSALYGKEG